MPYISRELRVLITPEIDALINTLLKYGQNDKNNSLDYKILSKMIMYSFFRVIKHFFDNPNAGWYKRGGDTKR
jgi:hypothetical protein